MVEIDDTQRDWDWQPYYDLTAMADDFIEELQRESADASGL